MDDMFWYAKGLIALTAVILLFLHMWKNSDEVTEWDQRCRYIVLFGYTMLVAIASPEQASEALPIQGRNIASLVVSAFAVYTAIISMQASKKRKLT